jgi:hypothetical protein
MSGSASSLLIQPLGLSLLFVVFWLGVCAMLSRIGGWSSLVAPFRAKYPPRGERFRFVSGSLGSERFPVSYKSSLFVVVSRHGLHLSVYFPFRFQSPALFIPWGEVDSVAEKPFLRTFGVTLRLRRPWPVISVRGQAGHSIREAFAIASAAKTL